MRLMPKELEREFEKYPLYSQEGKELDAHAVVVYSDPAGLGTWIITEGSKQPDGDWLLWGYCHIFCWEWGFVELSELEAIKLPYFALTVGLHKCGSKETVKDYLPILTAKLERD